ncbi:type 4a pilus biogenesis protein PilO [Vibrio sp. DW001]|uniref:type 4a pilus biogenesis protein PilO n=1 Tax=Vibrio sp. DW001 TaxID=2912315 RepID=UPI0023B19E94|nr:type 4a pilus biogenesis protein PilO [Vibrio sp. DW001]WED26908.1 type 4a pilus biogenesis protein PilO [Vibrio sp. DW001]
MNSCRMSWAAYILQLKQLKIEDVVQWPIFFKAGFLGGISLISQAIMCWFFIVPKIDEFDGLTDSYIEMQTMIAAKKKRLTQLPFLNQTIDVQDKQLALFLDSMVDENNLSNVLASISQLSKRDNLDIIQIKWGKKEPFRFLYRIPIHVELSGRYGDFVSLSQAIAQLKTVVVLDQFHLKKERSSRGMLKATMTAYTFQYQAVVSANE